MIKENPLVTVYMPTHNRRHLLERALKSVVDQTYKNLEIIVVDDGSSDDTERFMQEFIVEHSNVKYLKHAKPKGANAARNYAIREAKGYFVTGLDDDDEMVPTRIKELVNVYDDKYAYVFAKWNIINEAGEIYTQSYEYDTIVLSDMLYANITGNQVLTTKDMFFKAGLFDESLPAAQDYDMWIRLLQIRPRAKMLVKALYNVYITSHERITTSNKRKKGYFQCYSKHKTLMTIEQRRKNILYFRRLDSKQITSLNAIYTLFDIKMWPRLYLGYLKRSIQNKWKT